MHLYWKLMPSALALAIPSLAFAAREVVVPASDSTVVEVLRVRPFGGNKAPTKPTDAAGAMALARLHLESYRLDQDPRSLGRAAALVEPYAARENPLTEALVLRATVRQSLHDFDGALADLAAALRHDSGNRQALLTKSVIHQVRAEWAEARGASVALALSGNDLVTQTCIANLVGLTGSAAKADDLLATALETVGSSAPAEHRVWALTVRGEIAARRGDAASARKHFAEARAVLPGDLYLAGAAADLELAEGKWEAALAALPPEIDSDGILLRRMIAEKLAGRETWKSHAETYRARVADALLREDQVHLREQARFALEIDGDTVTALRLAGENWKVQREPADALLLAQVGLAAKDANAQDLVSKWLRDSKIEDVRLRQLLPATEAAK